jgi:hypothetical protein
LARHPGDSGVFYCTELLNGWKQVLRSTYWYIMKVRFVRNVLVEVEKIKLQEVWDVYLRRWDEVKCEKIDVQGSAAHLTTFDGDTLINVPRDAYEVIS